MSRTAPLAPEHLEVLRLPARATATVARVVDRPGCGRVVLVDGAPVGVVLYPPHDRRGRPTPPGTVHLALVWIDPAQVGRGLGRVLVQAMAADLCRRGGVHAVDAQPPWAPARPPAPRGFLTAVGFRPVAASAPGRLRLDLRTTLPDHAGWREEAEAVLGRLRGVVRPIPATRLGSPLQTTTAPPG